MSNCESAATLMTNGIGGKQDMSSIADPIHGQIFLPDYIQKIIDTPYFQRLRYINQLGLAFMTFESALHTRYEHCIGVYHLSDLVLQCIEGNTKLHDKHFTIPDKLKKCVKIAALLHDIGHGPFSHSWELILKAFGEKYAYDHEAMSSKIMRKLFIDYPILDKDTRDKDIELIEAFIKGNRDTLLQLLGKDYMFLSEIVHNSWCEIDVDKLDYLKRDTFYLTSKMPSKIDDIGDFYKGAKVGREGDDVTHIIYNISTYSNIYEFFKTRQQLHKNYYKHKLNMANEKVLSGILVKADKNNFKFKGHRMFDVHNNLLAFSSFDDTFIDILSNSLNNNDHVGGVQHDISQWKEKKYFTDLNICVGANPMELVRSFNTRHGHDYIFYIRIKISSASRYMQDRKVWQNLLFYNADNKVFRESQLPQDDNDEDYEKYCIFSIQETPANLVEQIKKLFELIE